MKNPRQLLLSSKHHEAYALKQLLEFIL